MGLLTATTCKTQQVQKPVGIRMDKYISYSDIHARTSNYSWARITHKSDWMVKEQQHTENGNSYYQPICVLCNMEKPGGWFDTTISSIPATFHRATNCEIQQVQKPVGIKIDRYISNSDIHACISNLSWSMNSLPFTA